MGDSRIQSTRTQASNNSAAPSTAGLDIQNSLAEVQSEIAAVRGEGHDPARTQRVVERATSALQRGAFEPGAAGLLAALGTLRSELQGANTERATSHVADLQQTSRARPARRHGRPSMSDAVASFRRTGNCERLMRCYGGSRQALGRLAGVSTQEFKAELMEAGATPAEASAMTQRVMTTMGQQFRFSAAEAARSQIADARSDIRQGLRGGLEPMATQMLADVRQADTVVARFRAAGLDPRGLEQAIHSGEPSKVARELRPLLTELDGQLRDLSNDLREASTYAGSIFVSFPGAARSAAQAMGIDPAAVDGQADGTVVGSGVAASANEARDAQEGAREWMSVTMMVVGFLGAGTAALYMGASVSASEMHGAEQRARDAGVAVNAGLETLSGAAAARAAADAEQVEQNIAVGMGMAGNILGHHAAHEVGHVLGHGVSETLQGIVENGVNGAVEAAVHRGGHALAHEAAHAVEHEQLHH